MSTLRYGTISLELIKTNSFAQEPQYSEDNKDYLYTRFTVDVTCIFNADVFVLGSDPAVTMRSVRQILLAPRQTLLIKVGTSILLESPAPDDNGGPIPLSCNITQISGTQTFIVTYRIQVDITDCNVSGQVSILSNRFAQDFTIDADGYSVRITRGKMVVRATTTLNADNFREVVIPPIPKGWRRTRMSFTPTTDGLTLGYSIEDTEVYQTPPSPATTARGHYSESTEKHGIFTNVEVECTLRGPKNSKKSDLIKRAAAICISRTRLSRGTGNDTLMGAAVSEQLFDNEISVRIRVRRTTGISQALAVNVLVNSTKLGSELQGVDGIAVDVGGRGSALALAVVAAFGNICGTGEFIGDIPSAISASSFPAGEDGIDPVDIDITPILPGTDPEWDDAHKLKPYTDYQIDTSYQTDQMKLQLPVAGPAFDLQGNATASQCVSLAAPIAKRIVKWRAERLGERGRNSGTDVNAPTDDYPDLPLPAPASGEVLLHKEQIPEAPRLMPDGFHYLFAVRGTYIYGLTKPRDETKGFISGVQESEELLAGSLPYDSSSLGGHVVPADKWRSGISHDQQ